MSMKDVFFFFFFSPFIKPAPKHKGVEDVSKKIIKRRNGEKKDHGTEKKKESRNTIYFAFSESTISMINEANFEA